MNTVEQYRERATVYERLAANALSQEHRERILEMARSCRELADERERMLMKGLLDPKLKGRERPSLR